MSPRVNSRSALGLLVVCLLASGCQSSKQQLLSAGGSQVELRSYQTRIFDTADRRAALRTVIATLQDLGFVIDKADDVLGMVSATKLDRYSLRMTVSVRPRGKAQLSVRANAQYGVTAVEDPGPYQDFFAALSKAMFLTANLDRASTPPTEAQGTGVVESPAGAIQPDSRPSPVSKRRPTPPAQRAPVSRAPAQPATVQQVQPPALAEIPGFDLEPSKPSQIETVPGELIPLPDGDW